MDESTPQEIFQGFEYANSELGFTQVGNKNFAILAGIDNLSEMKVTLYLMRNTWGYQEYEQGKLITTEEFVNGRKRKDDTRLDSGCGLKTTGVKEGLARGIEHGHIVCDVDSSDKGRIKKYYHLKMDENSKPVIDELDSRIATMPSRKATMDGRVTTIRESQRDHRTEKETLETHLKKQTKQKEERATSSQPTKPTSVQSIFSLEEQKILDWYGKLGTGHETSVKKAKEILPELIQHIHSFEDMQSLYDFTVPRITGDDSTIYLANMARYIKLWEKNKTTQTVTPEQDMSEKVLWSRYGLLPNFETSVDLWFLFEMMSRMEAMKYGIAKNGELFGKKLRMIEDRLDASNEQTRRGLIEQWASERMAIAV